MFNKSKLLTLTVVTVLGQNAFGGDTREEDRGRGRGYEPRHSCVSPEQIAALKLLLATAKASSASPVPVSSPDLTRSISPVLFGKEVKVVLVSPKGVVRRSSMEEINDALLDAQLGRRL